MVVEESKIEGEEGGLYIPMQSTRAMEVGRFGVHYM